MSDEEDAGAHGGFCWYELMTADPVAAASFYRAAIGWTVEETASPIVPYWRFEAAGVPVAGVMALPEELQAKQVPPFWGGFVAVDDVDATVAQAVSLGATIAHPASDIPAIGRWATIKDPQGAYLNVMRRAYDMALPPARPPQAGYGAWRELFCDDPVAGLDFYAALFGWSASTAIDMGAMGVYQLFARNGEDVGGMMRRPPIMEWSAWAYHFSVDGAAAAAARVEQAGGRRLMGPMQVPGGQWVVTATDPQGAFFGMVSWNP